MKKIALVLSLAFLAFSCSSDDDGGSSSGLVGTWKTVSESENGIPFTLDECELSNTITFTSDMVVSTDIYDNGGDECFIDEPLEESYSANGDTITVDGETVSYLISESLLTITFTSTDDDETVTYVDVYSKQ